MQSKESLRQQFLDRRQQMAPAEVVAKSQIIAQKLISTVDWPRIKSVHVYKSVPAWHEVDTSGLVAWIKEHHPQISVVQPSASKGSAAPKTQFDLVIVPVLAFDKNNNRLGLGGGWYDRFLAKQQRALKIGLAWRDSQTGLLPREPHDIPVDKVIT